MQTLIDPADAIALAFALFFMGIGGAWTWYIILAMAIGVPLNWGIDALKTR